jgi:hypothetical protein
VPTTYVHQATVILAAGADPATLGGAVTVALCGGWEHDGPCAWPHHSGSTTEGDRTLLRTVFSVEADDEPAVRRRIDAALAAGSQAGPDGATTSWCLLASGPDRRRAVEAPDERQAA